MTRMKIPAILLMVATVSAHARIGKKTEDKCPYTWQWQCDNGQCIPRDFRCDGGTDYDCDDGSDERNCADCPSDRPFPCTADSVCVEAGKVCDGYRHCGDGSDELMCKGKCSNPNPSVSTYECHSGECVAQYVGGYVTSSMTSSMTSSLRCDGERNCRDGSDEWNCTDNCPTDRPFQCATGSQCVSTQSVCEGTKHCRDGSDELDCKGRCQSEFAVVFECEDGECVLWEDDGWSMEGRWRCDGVRQCRDGTDERNCTEIITPEQWWDYDYGYMNY